MSPPRGNFIKTSMKLHTFSYSKLKKEGKEDLSGFSFTYRIKLGNIKIFIIKSAVTRNGKFSALLKGRKMQLKDMALLTESLSFISILHLGISQIISLSFCSSNSTSPFPLNHSAAYSTTCSLIIGY